MLAAAAHSDMHQALTGVVVLFGAALAAAWAMRFVRLPSILGFLLAGIFVGPSGLDLVPHERITFFAELGLTLLLFTVGLELSPAPLLRAGRQLGIASAIQIGGTTLLAALAVGLLGGVAVSPSLIVGIGVALSSTAIVLKHLSDHGETDSPSGALTTGILLVQDMVVILVLIVLPLIGGASGPAEGLTSDQSSHGMLAIAFKILLALGGLIAVTFLARLSMPVLVRHIFRFGGQEITTLFAIVMACLGAWLASLADWSWPLGAFIAGLLLAQCDLRHQLHAEITPFRDAFNALFFISIGMLFEISTLAQYPVLLPVAILSTLLIKAALVAGAVLVAGWPLRLALTVGLGLCTISEFGYVLVIEAHRLEMVPDQILPVFLVWAVGTMLLGALLVPVAAPAAVQLMRLFGRDVDTPEPSNEGHGLRDHVIIIGYGLNGSNLHTVLKQTGIAHNVIEMHRSNANRVRESGAEVVVGDATRRSILAHAGIHSARALVICIADQHATRSIVAQAHQMRPDLYILARTHFISELEPLYRLGAQQVIPEEFETSIEIFAHVLKEFAVPDNIIDQQVTLVRAGQYGMLRGRVADRTMRAEWLSLLEAAVTQTYLIPDESPANGQTIREIDLRAKTGVSIVAVTRCGQPTPNPAPDFKLAGGDVLVLVGSHQGLDRTRRWLDGQTD
jgi:CPA2 family monovalent cation:H+ antiporter-2